MANEINAGLFDNIDKMKELGTKAKEKLKSGIKEQVDHVAHNLKLTKEAVAFAYQEPRMSNILQAVGYSTATLYGVFTQANHAAHSGVLTVLSHIVSHEALHKIGHNLGHKERVQKIDKVLDKYPVVKKLTGPAMAGLLLYGYCLAPNNKLGDWNLSNVKKALSGDYTVHDLVSSSEVVSLTAAVASGHAFSLSTIVESVGTLSIALAANAIIHSDNPKLAKAGKHVQSAFDKFRAKKSPMEDIQNSKDFKGTKEEMGINPAEPSTKTDHSNHTEHTEHTEHNEHTEKDKKADHGGHGGHKQGGDWFHKLSEEKQKEYLSEHPNSVFHKASMTRISAATRLLAHFNPRLMEDAKHVDYKARYKVIRMRIDDFLKMALPLSKPDADKAQTVKELIRKGKDFETLPFLYFDVNGTVAKVTGHEGRHRALALRELGETTIPVEIRGPIRWSEQSDPDRFDYWEKWPTTLVSENGSAKIPFPVKREDADKGYV